MDGDISRKRESLPAQRPVAQSLKVLALPSEVSAEQGLDSATVPAMAPVAAEAQEVEAEWEEELEEAEVLALVPESAAVEVAVGQDEARVWTVCGRLSRSRELSATLARKACHPSVRPVAGVRQTPGALG